VKLKKRKDIEDDEYNEYLKLKQKYEGD